MSIVSGVNSFDVERLLRLLVAACPAILYNYTVTGSVILKKLYSKFSRES